MASKGSDSYEKTSVIRGHHNIYKSIWTLFIGEELVVEAKTATSTLSLWWRTAVSLGASHIVSPKSHGSSWNVVAVFSAVLQESKSLELVMPWWEYINTRNGVTPSAGTWHLFETQWLLFMWLSLDPAYKRGRCLFEGGFYSWSYHPASL